MQRKYPFSAYDEYLCLKMSAGMWLVLVFLFRPYAIMVMSFATKRDRMGLINLFYDDRAAMALGAVAAMPMVLIIYAWIKRRPGAAAHVRHIWNSGRWIMLGSALINVAIPVWPILGGTKPDLVAMGQLALSALIIFYLLLSPRVRETFADFPEDIEEEGDGGKQAPRGAGR